MARKMLEYMSDERLLAYVEEQLGAPYYRTLGDITKDFYKRNGKNVSITDVQRRLRDAEPGVIITYRPTGILLRHPVQLPEPVEAEE